MFEGNRNVPISNDCADFNMINNCFEDVQPPAANTSKSCLEMFMLFVNILCLGGKNLWGLRAIIIKKKLQGLVFIWYRQELIKSDLDNIVKNLDNTYSDFALELNGAKIVKVDAEPVAKKSFFGVGLCDSCENFDPQGPSKIIQPSMRPGECWAFHGSKATAVIKLSRDVLIRDVTLEHLEKNFSPSHKNDFAPKNFKIWVRIFFGRSTYLSTLQFISIWVYSFLIFLLSFWISSSIFLFNSNEFSRTHHSSLTPRIS